MKKQIILISLMMLPFSVISRGDEKCQESINIEIKNWINNNDFWRKDCEDIYNISDNTESKLSSEIKCWIRNKKYWDNSLD